MLAQIKKLGSFLFAESGGLRHQVVRGGLWVFVGQGLKQVNSVARIVVLARLLSPRDFGLMGIALVTLSFLDTFTETGHQSALIQRRGEITPYLNSVFTVQIGRGLLLALGLYLGAPWVAEFFKNPEAVPIVQSVALVVLLRGLVNPGVVFLQRNLEFRKQFYWNISEVVVSLGLAIGFAFWLRNVWALVLATIGGVLTQAVGSYFVSSYRPRPEFRWALVRELSRFGKWIFGLNCIVYLSSNLDAVAVGRLAGTTALGFYQLAYRIANLPTTEVAKVLSMVAFPFYAKVQTERAKAVRFFSMSVRLVMLAGMPLVFVILFLGEPAVRLVLGSKWLPMLGAMQALVFCGQFRMLISTGGPLYQGLGRPEYATKMNLLRLVVLAALLYPFTVQWGILGAAWAAVASLAVTIPYWISRSASCLAVPRREIVRELLRPTAVVALFCGLPCWLVSLTLPVNAWPGFLPALGIVAGLYAGGIAASRKTGFLDLSFR